MFQTPQAAENGEKQTFRVFAFRIEKSLEGLIQQTVWVC